MEPKRPRREETPTTRDEAIEVCRNALTARRDINVLEAEVTTKDADGKISSIFFKDLDGMEGALFAKV